MKITFLALALLAVGCTKGSGVRIMKASTEQTAEVQVVLDQLREQTGGVVNRYLTSDPDAATTIVFNSQREHPLRCGWTSVYGDEIIVYPCGYENGIKVFGGNLLHELIHAEGEPAHTPEEIPSEHAIMHSTMDLYQAAPYCLHQADLDLLCKWTGCSTRGMQPCDDGE